MSSPIDASADPPGGGAADQAPGRAPHRARADDPESPPRAVAQRTGVAASPGATFAAATAALAAMPAQLLQSFHSMAPEAILRAVGVATSLGASAVRNPAAAPCTCSARRGGGAGLRCRNRRQGFRYL